MQQLFGTPFPVPFAAPGQNGVYAASQDTEYVGIFGQATWNISDKFAITGGLRVAFLIPPKQFVGRATDAVWATMFMAPTLTVEVAATWIEARARRRPARGSRRPSVS